jgi:hypothetical protein
MAMRLPLALFEPLRHGAAHYVPVLQNRRGELEALTTASTSAWDRMTPILRIVGPKRPGLGPLNSVTVRGWIKRAHDAVGDHAVFLDTLRLNPTRSVATPGAATPVLRMIHEQARKRGMQFVPVLHLGETYRAEAKIIADAIDEDGRGVAIHYPANLAVPAGLTVADLLSTGMEAAGASIESADLWIDLAYLSPDEEIWPSEVVELLDEMADVGGWRNIVLTGTSMPSMLGGVIDEGTIGSLDRQEWRLWTELNSRVVTRMPTFGDFAVQHPYPPHEDGGPGMRCNIRYTVDDAFRIARGAGPAHQAGKEQYRLLAQHLCSFADNQGRTYSWGDRTLDDVANRGGDPGWHTTWRGVGTSHHLQFVTDQLTRRLKMR